MINKFTYKYVLTQQNSDKRNNEYDKKKVFGDGARNLLSL